MAKAIADMTADELTAFETKIDKALATPAGTLPDALQDRPRVPGQINGAMAKSSQRFSLTRALTRGVMKQERESAKFELDALERLRKAINNSRHLPPGGDENSYWLPMNWDFLPEDVRESEDAKYCKSVMEGSGMTSDPDEETWLVKKGVIYKAQSAYSDSLGGTMVPPAQMGPVIPLIRPNAAVIAAGAQTRPLPPQGRYTQPRITGAPSVQAVAESQDAPESNMSTDQLVLTAKKIAGMARVTEEATAFSSGTIDTYTKNELDRSLGLKMDAYAFYGPGGTSIPAGLTSSTYTSAVINIDTAYPAGKGVGANGNSLLPQYGDLLPALIGERSFGMDAGTGTWVMRPGAYASAVALRSDAVLVGDTAGPKVDILRRFAESGPSMWSGRRVVQTTNILGTTSKGASGAVLSDVFFGIWNHCIVATYGAIQFATGYDSTAFARGQYLVRGILWGDVGFEYPGAFLWMPYVLGVAGQI